LIITPFPDSVRRATAETAMKRNRLMAELAEEVVMGYVSMGGNLETLVAEFSAKRKMTVL
jgi:hypothetical protein